ncbi:Y-family DNA polymerase [Spirosoma endophyticum]|uniref:DNA polymerase V n=1 Tax=Spirosoma endophyticum TaxID=662367 RepID=A0A1I1ZIR2_9BACT|nr:Y-family DNA polymerase [Spirosoma endophyticum]SFE31589.1 DNA polymerase V [Spirosoma endophyticum]
MLYGLVDANAFYVSCERSFQPRLEDKPVIVLSNRDGCIVARSDEVKALGIKMSKPLFEYKELIEANNVQVFSSNYALYADMSRRLMSTLTHFVDDVEVYSVDEAFILADGYEGIYPSVRGLGESIRQTVAQWLRIPVSVGFGPTKTLAKVANKLAKKQPELAGVCVLDTQEAIDQALDQFPVGDLWGVGGRYTGMLKGNGVETAAQLRDLPDDWIRQFMTVNGLRLVHELRGTPCKMLELSQPAKKSICAEPGFGTLVADLETLTDALTSHLSRCSEKLRKQDSLCGAVTVYLKTNKFRKTPGNGLPAKHYYKSITVELPHPTNSTPDLLKYAVSGLKAIFAFGYNYQKIGVMLTDLVPFDYRQKGVFVDGPNEKMLQLFTVVDRLNRRYGQDKLRLASQQYNPDWPMKQKYLSPRYTTRWEDILEAK